MRNKKNIKKHFEQIDSTKLSEEDKTILEIIKIIKLDKVSLDSLKQKINLFLNPFYNSIQYQDIKKLIRKNKYGNIF